MSECGRGGVSLELECFFLFKSFFCVHNSCVVFSFMLYGTSFRVTRLSFSNIIISCDWTLIQQHRYSVNPATAVFSLSLSLLVNRECRKSLCQSWKRESTLLGLRGIDHRKLQGY